MAGGRRPLTAILAVAVWLAAVAAGLGALAIYKTTPGEAGTAPQRYPAQGHGREGDPAFRLLLFAHPYCPCTRASLQELAQIVARAGDRLAVRILFVYPAGEGEAEPADLWESAAAIPGVRVGRDEGGVEARRFGARTSGHVVLYNAAGELLYSGGITRSRGHEGDNPGRDAVLALLSGEAASCRGPVFGCPLFGNPAPGDGEDK